MTNTPQGHAQFSPESPVYEQVESRLKAIYEKREFRSKNPRIDWFADSSGYFLWESDSKESKPVGYDVRTGQKVTEEKSKAVSSDKKQLASPDGTKRLEFRKRDLFVRDLKSQKLTQLTKRDKDRDLSYRDVAWSPDGSHIVFVEFDQTDVRKRAVLVPDDPSYPGVDYHRFARVGETIPSLRVGVINVTDQQIQWLPIEAPEEGFYLGQVDWAGNSQEVLVETLSRFRDKREFLIVSLEGEIESIHEEQNSAWAVGSHGINSGLTWVQNGQAFIFISEQDGWRHAFLHKRSGKKIATLTPGEYDIIDRAVVDEAGGWYYFYASPDHGPEKHLYRVPLDGSGTLERITPADQPGTHDYEFSPDANWAIHTYSRLDTPPVVEVVNLPEHKSYRVLEDHSELQQKMETLITHPTEFLQLDIGEGVTVDASMVKPKDFDPGKKYPVFIYVYGEPYLQTVLDRWGAAQIDFHRVIADLGYLVVSIDNRGTPAPKGAAWRRSIYKSLGPLSTEDQAAALKELGRTLPYVDLSRVGIWGWSGGGSNTLNAMFRKPDQYHVGIAVVPKPQPHLYNAWFQEIYMQTRESNPEGYEHSAPLHFAEGLKGDLLIITGSGETNTHIQIIEGLVDRLVELGKPFDYFVYPNRDHGLREGAGSEYHVRMMIIRYLMNHLAAGPR